MSFDDRYGTDVLAGDWRNAGRVKPVPVAAEPDVVVEDAQTGFCGAVVRVEAGAVELEDRRGARRVFPLGGGFLIDGKPVVLTPPGRARGTGAGAASAGSPTRAGRRRTASGSFAVPDAPARVARASRIFVEGRHDAELVEKVWGDDLRVEGVVVEYLAGVDNLADVLAEFRPGEGRRAGVLVDHLVDGSKESRIVEQVMRGRGGENVLVVGHPYVDVWQAVKPSRLGWERWPRVPRTIEWKHGICEALGWPHNDQADIASAWKRILGTVRTYADLEPAVLGRVEELIDFVTAG